MPDNLPSEYQPYWSDLQLQSCLVATTSNLNATLIPDVSEPNGLGTILENNGTLTNLSIDGVNVSVADRVLVCSQTNQEENGVYIVKIVGDVSTAWQLVRDPAFCDPLYILPGLFAIIESGSTKKGKIYVLVRPTPTEVNTDPIYFVEN